MQINILSKNGTHYTNVAILEQPWGEKEDKVEDEFPCLLRNHRSGCHMHNRLCYQLNQINAGALNGIYVGPKLVATTTK